MKLSRASSYALHAVAFMAAQKSDRPVASHIVAQARGIPERFLLKVLKPLVAAGMLKSVKGPNGGYSLAHSPGDINLLQIIEAIDGPLRGHSPFADENNAPLNKKLESICAQGANLIREHLHKIKLIDLMGRKPA